MEKSRIEKLKKEIKENLTSSKIGSMSREEYFTFAKDFFIWLENQKINGVRKNDIFDFLDLEILKNESSIIDNDEIIGIRLEIIIYEILDYCELPSFWRDPFEIYIIKWDDYKKKLWIR